jgi:glycosyltransferase involved in cell wall biosynthesis
MAVNAPGVSIVTATFNRSSVLRLTIEALLRSTYGDWELIVVGDACTDDTAHVVASFQDPRIRFVNLEENSGEQATPNNEGVRLARGRYLAFLNHDDLWTSQHLSLAVQQLETTGADFVSTLTLASMGDGRVHLAGVCPQGTYDPSTWIPASSWLMRRELMARVGPWKPARELYTAPSQDWLFRAHRIGARMHAIPIASVVAVMSGGRKNSYASAATTDNETLAARLRDDPSALLIQLLTEAAHDLSAREIRPSLAVPLQRFVKNVIRRGALAVGVAPSAVYNAAMYRRKGGLLDALRRTRGLPPLPRNGGTHG